MPIEKPELFQDVLHPRKRTPFWKVLVVMLLAGLVIGWRVCRLESISQEEREMRNHP